MDRNGIAFLVAAVVGGILFLMFVVAISTQPEPNTVARLFSWIVIGLPMAIALYAGDNQRPFMLGEFLLVLIVIGPAISAITGMIIAIPIAIFKSLLM